MSQKDISESPSLIKFWRNDLIAAFSVALVAIPLGLGISIASGAPPLSGIITAIIGGLFTTFYRGTNLAINGPGAGLIVVTLTGITALSDPGLNNGWQYYMAAVVLAGAILTVIGLLKWGKYADLLPSSVVRGMLAAIGVIIFASQIHVALDTGFKGANPLENILAIPKHLDNINLPIALIALISVIILVIHPLFINKFRILHYIPAPMLVLLAAVPFVYIFDLQTVHSLFVGSHEFEITPDRNLVTLPANFMDGLTLRPDFSKLNTSTFWITVMSIVVLSSIESLMSAKAIDKLDPLRRTTKLNRDMIGVGMSTILSGFAGGLPVITVVVRSSVNINHGAKTKWSNLYHGILVLIIIFFFEDLIQLVPMAALAAILVFTGFKLASPRMFSDAYKMGYEQFVIIVFTLFSAIRTGLITGLMLGTIITLLIHLVKSHIPANLFFKFLRNPSYRTQEEDGQINLKVKGVSNFCNILSFSDALNSIGFGKEVIVDFSHARLVDHSILEHAYGWGDKNVNKGGQFNIVGLDEHITTSQHPLSLKVLPLKNVIFLSNRQQDLKNIAAQNNWSFDPSTIWSKSRFSQFKIFEHRSLEYSKNIVKGVFKSNNLSWEVCDITFDEGAIISAEVHHSTIILIHLPFHIPAFVMEKETLFHKILDLATKEEIEFEDQAFSDDFSVKGEERDEIRNFFGTEFIQFLMTRSKFHIESDEKALLIFDRYRFASPDEIVTLINFSESLTNVLLSQQLVLKTES